MTKQESSMHNKLKDNNFKLWGCIKIEDGKLNFSERASTKKCKCEGFVYAWIKADPEGIPVQVCYIGMAGGTLWGRWRTHSNGFKNDSTGKKNSSRIKSIINKGSSIQIWVRRSLYERLFGVEISRCLIEESALIKAWKPSWDE